VRGEVEYSNVSFAYEDSAPVLSHVSLHIAPGECLAVVGRPAAERLTLCHLLPRFYDVTEGAVAHPTGTMSAALRRRA
jgi:ATP-binding cassette subfamily B protein